MITSETPFAMLIVFGVSIHSQTIIRNAAKNDVDGSFQHNDRRLPNEYFKQKLVDILSFS
jgi:hypothetical protein